MSPKSPNSAKTLGIEPARARRGADAGVAEPVVQAALLGVGEHRVRFGRHLELFFGFRVARIAIRVMFHGQLAIGALDLDLGRRPRNPEDLVVVLLACCAFAHAFATFTIAGRSSLSPMR